MISNEDEIIKALEAATPAEIVNSEVGVSLGL